MAADSAGELPFSATDGGVRLRVRLTPRAGRNAIVGTTPGSDGRPALRLRVAAPPVEGAANAALIAYVAHGVKLRQSDVRIISGATARVKLLMLSGASDLIVARLTEWIAAAGGRGS